MDSESEQTLKRVHSSALEKQTTGKEKGKQSVPIGSISWSLTIGEDGSHFQIGSGQPNDGRLVQLTGDGRRQWQQFGQLQKFCILLLATRAGSILGLFFHFTVPSSSHSHTGNTHTPGHPKQIKTTDQQKQLEHTMQAISFKRFVRSKWKHGEDVS